MPDESLIEQRDDLLVAFALLIDPIRRVFKEPDWQQRLPYLQSLMNSEIEEVIHKLDTMCQKAGIHTSYPWRAARNNIYELNPFLQTMYGSDVATAKAGFDSLFKAGTDAIKRLPVQHVGTILPAQSPFSTYLRLTALMRAALSRVQLFDAYLDDTVYQRYVTAISSTVPFILITDHDTMKGARRDRIVAVSKLLAKERPDTYSLLVAPELHDRHLRCDDKILHLGNSVKDAAEEAPYTISNLDPTQSNDATLDAIIAKSVEWVGPNVKTHRTQH